MTSNLLVMIVEDNLMLADLLEEVLVSHGHRVCGIARTVDQGVRLGRDSSPDLAIIDVRLADNGFGPDVAAALADQTQMAVLYATGNLDIAMVLDARGQGCLVKPYRVEDLVQSLDVVDELHRFGHATSPIPRGFHILPNRPKAIADVDHG
jgi:DNA-binding response OmpR family regulator